MKVAATLLSAVVGLAAAATITEPPNGASAPVASVDPAQASTLGCIRACRAGDVSCQAQCQGLPTPDETAVNATHNCVAACPSSSGSDADNAAWAECQQKCVAALYYTASITTPIANAGSPQTTLTGSAAGNTNAARPTGSSNGNRNGGNSNGDSDSDASGSGSDADASSSGANPSASQSANAAAAAFVISKMPMVGVLGLFLGALAI
ncbi:hypothetical protein TWF696_002036 [Orbilia brochopaga]|uniref:Uncharacterized protein n=1 Tax=Orbilia brochopaga TaxID=3140254 RepID=A0AAV9UA11_9PEZI